MGRLLLHGLQQHNAADAWRHTTRLAAGLMLVVMLCCIEGGVAGECPHAQSVHWLLSTLP
jgi:hypothetical protein